MLCWLCLICVGVGQNVANDHIKVLIFVEFSFPNVEGIRYYNWEENEYHVTQFRHI